MARLIWSPQSVDDLEAICEYIAKDSPEYARIVAGRIWDVVESIPLQPRAGRVVPEYGLDELRERIVGNYRLIYRLVGEDVQVVTIFHGARVLKLEDRQD